MRKVVALVLIGVMLYGLTGCATITINAPKGAEVKLAQTGQSGIAGCTLYAQKRYVYLLYGLVPLGDNTTSSIMPQKGNVVVQTEFTVVDYLLNALGGSFTLAFKTAKIYKCPGQ